MIAYFRGKSLVSRMIRWRTWGKYSHVAWIVDRDFDYTDPNGRKVLIPAGTIYESWHRKAKGAKRSGVRKGVAGDLHKPGTSLDLYAIELDDAQNNELLQRLEDWANDPEAGYDFRGAISGFVVRKDRAHSDKRLFCSELLMRCFSPMGIRFLINIKPWQTAPEDMSHSPLQILIGGWSTGKPWLYYGHPPFKLPVGWR